jgi:hypothetical protein
MFRNFLLSAYSVVCFFLSNVIMAQAPSWAWSKNANGTSYGLAKDATGHTLLTGYFSNDTIAFGSAYHLNSSASSSDIFLGKFDGNGTVAWIKGAVGRGNDYAYSTATDASGNIFVCGSFTSDTLLFGSFLVINTVIGSGFRDLFVAKFDSNGNPLWARGAGGTNTDEAYSVAVDATGNCYVTGYYGSSAITFGTYTLTQTGIKDIFLSKYDANGTIQWVKTANGNDQDFSRSVAVDPSGNIWTTGYFQSQNLSVGTTTLTNAGWGFSDVFVLKYDPSGNLLNGKRFGISGHEESYSISSDPTGNMFIGGWYKSPTLNFGTATFTNQGQSDWFLAKMDPSLNVLWERSSGGSQDDVINSISADALGNVYTTGSFRNTIPFATSTLVSAGFTDAFVAKYNGAGTEQFSIRAGAGFFDGGTVVMADNTNGCVISGAFQDSIQFGAQPKLYGFGLYLAKSGSVTGIKEKTGSAGVSIYPNPSAGIFLINNFNSFDITFEVRDILGGVVKVKESISAKSAQSCDLTNLSKGIYFVNLWTTSGDRCIHKIVLE